MLPLHLFWPASQVGKPQAEGVQRAVLAHVSRSSKPERVALQTCRVAPEHLVSPDTHALQPLVVHSAALPQPVVSSNPVRAALHVWNVAPPGPPHRVSPATHALHPLVVHNAAL